MRAFAAGRPSPLPELAVQYADFAAWQRSWLSGDVLERELRYWRDRLAGAPPVLELPADRPAPGGSELPRRGVHPVAAGGAVSQALAALSPPGRRDALHDALASAFTVLLSRFAGEADLTLGTPVAGRNRLEIEPLIGFFVNTLVLRPDLSGEPRFTELLARVRREALDAYAHQDLPFEKLVEDLAPERSRNVTPLFQVMLAWQDVLLGELALPGLRLVPQELLSTVAKFDLSLTLHPSGDRIEGSLSYARDLFDAPTIDRLAAAFSVLLAALVEDPELPVAAAPASGDLANGINSQSSGTPRTRPGPPPARCRSCSPSRRRPTRNGSRLGVWRGDAELRGAGRPVGCGGSLPSSAGGGSWAMW